jgi:hypothetical protein
MGERQEESLFPHTYDPSHALTLSSQRPAAKSQSKEITQDTMLLLDNCHAGPSFENLPGLTSSTIVNLDNVGEDDELQETPSKLLYEDFLSTPRVSSRTKRETSKDSHERNVSDSGRSSSSKTSPTKSVTSDQKQLVKEVSNQIMGMLQTDFNHLQSGMKERKRRAFTRKVSLSRFED